MTPRHLRDQRVWPRFIRPAQVVYTVRPSAVDTVKAVCLCLIALCLGAAVGLAVYGAGI